MNKPEEVVGISSNVFIGYVEEMTDTYYVSHFPYTRYNVTVINNIKGELPLNATIQVNKEGGLSEDSSYYLLFEKDFLPDKGEYYIFSVRKRSEDNSYTASGMNTAVPLDDIDMSPISDYIHSDNTNQVSSNEQIEIKNTLENSAVYQTYVDAFKNQIPFDKDK